MSVEDVAERTSSTVGSHEEWGALFDETAGAYRRLRVRTETIMQDTLVHHLRESLRPYGRIKLWSSLNNDATNPAATLNLTSELDATVQQLSSFLAFLSSALAQAPLRRITNQISVCVQTFLWDHVLLRNTFSESGIAQFTRDVSALWEVIDRYLGPGKGELCMRKLKEALALLRLRAGEGEMQDDDGKIGLGLLYVEKMLFRSNESGREVLDDLGIELLSESEARNVLERELI